MGQPLGGAASGPDCADVCPGGVDSHPTDPGMTRMLAALLSAQARGAFITVQYDIQAGRCVALSTTVYKHNNLRTLGKSITDVDSLHVRLHLQNACGPLQHSTPRRS